ncbi:MAG TPA: hypothetical protein VD859_03095, partial [Nocardioides sp.]|nr:hypothetical protein [Nocardioides sp.]
TGTLTVSTLVPMRSVPHRVVCLMGMDADAFPRTITADGDDALARDPRTGERDPRAEDRQLLLDAVMSARDVDRLRYILRMQCEHYLPLRVIREHLDAIDRGLEPPQVDPVVPTVPKVALTADGLPAAESYRRTDRFRLSRKELLKIAEIDEDLLGQLEDFGLLTATRTGHYDTDALVVAQAAKELADFGLEPRHLRAFKTAADREVGLVEQVVAPVRRGRDAAASARAEEAMSEIAALSVRLHATLVKIGLGRL